MSLSIGEIMATGAANLYRHYVCKSFLEEYFSSGMLKQHFPYVDDTLSYCIVIIPMRSSLSPV